MTTLKTPEEVAKSAFPYWEELSYEEKSYNDVENVIVGDRQATAQVLCDLLEFKKHLIHNPHRSDEEEEYIHNLAIETAQALIRQTLDPISNQESKTNDL